MDQRNRREVLGLAAAATVLVAAAGHASEKPTDPADKAKARAEPDEKTLQEMARRAKAISDKAYCPYSKFRVGAVVLTAEGQMFDGCNVENASYGLTICAERNAVFQMVASAKPKIAAVVIYTPTKKPSAPCGACRQVINEFGPDAFIMSVCEGEAVLRKRLSELLPDAFGPANLQ